jgi:hypothetical protein
MSQSPLVAYVRTTVARDNELYLDPSSRSVPRILQGYPPPVNRAPNLDVDGCCLSQRIAATLIQGHREHTFAHLEGPSLSRDGGRYQAQSSKEESIRVNKHRNSLLEAVRRGLKEPPLGLPYRCPQRQNRASLAISSPLGASVPRLPGHFGRSLGTLALPDSTETTASSIWYWKARLNS